MVKCECCREHRGYYLKGSYRLCKFCKDISFDKVRKMITLRQEKQIEKAISKLLKRR